MSNPWWSPGLIPTRLLCPRDSPGKNTGVGCHFLLPGILPIQGSSPRLSHLPTGRRILHHFPLSRQHANCGHRLFTHLLFKHRTNITFLGVGLLSYVCLYYRGINCFPFTLLGIPCAYNITHFLLTEAFIYESLTGWVLEILTYRL